MTEHTIQKLCRYLATHDWYHGMADRIIRPSVECERRILEATEQLGSTDARQDVIDAWRLAAPNHLGSAFGAGPTAPDWVREVIEGVKS